MVLLPGFTPMQAAGRGRGRGKPRGGRSRGGKNKKKNKNNAPVAGNAAQPTTATSNVAPPPLMPPPERNAPPEQVQSVNAQADVEAPIVEETSQSFISSTEVMEDSIEVSVNEDFAGDTWQIISEETASPEMKGDDSEFASDILSTGDLFSQQSANDDALLDQPDLANDYQEDIIDVKVEEPLSTHEEEVIAVEETAPKSEEQPLSSSVEHPLPDETEKKVEEKSTAKRTAILPPKDTGKETTQKPLPLKCEVKFA